MFKHAYIGHQFTITESNQEHYELLQLSFLFNVFQSFFKKCIDLREGERNINNERESWIGCLLHAPYWGSGLEFGHVPLTGIEPGTFQSAG